MLGVLSLSLKDSPQNWHHFLDLLGAMTIFTCRLASLTGSFDDLGEMEGSETELESSSLPWGEKELALVVTIFKPEFDLVSQIKRGAKDC